MDIHKKLTDQERIRFAKNIETFYAASHGRLGRTLWASIVQGIGRGFGFVIGGTIVVAILLWILSLLGSVPFVGELSESAKDTIQQSTE